MPLKVVPVQNVEKQWPQLWAMLQLGAPQCTFHFAEENNDRFMIVQAVRPDGASAVLQLNAPIEVNDGIPGKLEPPDQVCIACDILLAVYRS